MTGLAKTVPRVGKLRHPSGSCLGSDGSLALLDCSAALTTWETSGASPQKPSASGHSTLAKATRRLGKQRHPTPLVELELVLVSAVKTDLDKS